METRYKNPSLICTKILIFVIVVIGSLLVYNTWPHEPKAIKELIDTIEKSIKGNTKTFSSNHKLKENKKVEHYSANSDEFDSIGLPLVKKEETFVETSKEGGTPEFYTIKLDDFENALKAVALVSRQEAAEDYHKSFSILVTILTLFGIGFPILFSLIQFKFHEKELDNIFSVTESTKKLNLDILELSETFFYELSQHNNLLAQDYIKKRELSKASMFLLEDIFYNVKQLRVYFSLDKLKNKYSNYIKGGDYIKNIEQNFSVIFQSFETYHNLLTESKSAKDFQDYKIMMYTDLNELKNITQNTDDFKNGWPNKRFNDKIQVLHEKILKALKILE